MIGFPPAPSNGRVPKKLDDAASVDWVRRVTNIVNTLLLGKLNASLAVTLAAGAATTDVKDARITATSVLLFQPLTAHAAAALYTAPYIFATNQKSGEVTLNHLNDANADKNFTMLIIG